MRRRIAALVALTVVPLAWLTPVDAGGGEEPGSFVARAVPFPAMQSDIYYPGKGSCLAGMEGIHKVSTPFHDPASGTLTVHLEGLSGDWDIYVLGKGGDVLGRSENAQVLDGAEGKERVAVPLASRQRVRMVACNWLGEPEVTVKFDFVAKSAEGTKRHDHYSKSRSGRAGGETHEVAADGGPVTPLWEWDPSELEISVGHKVEWLNETGSDHHVTAYGGPWKDVDVMHLPTGKKVGFIFRKPGEYLYRCDFAFGGVEHSLLAGDECLGMCGRIVVQRHH